MQQYFDFYRLIEKYSDEYIYQEESNGSYVGGIWQGGNATETKKTGAILSYSLNKIYQSGGVLNQQDRVLYSYEPLSLNAKVIYEGNKYNIESNEYAGNEKFTGFFVYSLKWVSSFDKTR